MVKLEMMRLEPTQEWNLACDIYKEVIQCFAKMNEQANLKENQTFLCLYNYKSVMSIVYDLLKIDLSPNFD